ncbi:hypothetical protein [Legionella clemsonensis]|uniref:Ankyrin repeats (3 copies) n=1 Tax=Legionella clemsonensis TaxID=1867846 RepID=A0A222P3Z8_9GAMM|nr:hypothetical protein [Legionella clemsonensis]ASQ46547.1 hypothetical protein clem_09990 [Legionella clemsonensis]
MKKFVAGNYYIRKPESIYSIAVGDRIELKPAGIELANNYYNEKYQSDLSYSPFGLYIEKEILESRKKETLDYRKAFIVNEGSSPGYHSLSVIYIKENNDEILLLVDSQGSEDKEYQKIWAKNFFKKTGIPSYAVSDVFQSDNYSCHTASLTIAKDCTAKINGQYKLTNLLTSIKERSEKPYEGFAWAKLPDELLKVSQLSKFVKQHTEHSTRKVDQKKEKTLKEYRQSFTATVKIASEEFHFNDYLRRKGLKLANAVEIQYYVEALQAEFATLQTEFEKVDTEFKELQFLFQHSWPKYRELFIKRAKEILKEKDPQENLYRYASSFIEQQLANAPRYQEFIAALPVEFIEKKLLKAVEDDQLADVQKLITLKTSNRPGIKVISDILNKAATYTNGKWDIVQALLSMTEDNKPNKANVTDTLNTAIDANAIGVVQYICQMSGDNKPDEKAIADALDFALESGNFKAVQALCQITGGNKLRSKAIDEVLQKLARKQYIYSDSKVVQYLQDAKKIALLYERIEALKEYGTTLKKQGYAADGDAAISSADDLKQMTDTFLTLKAKDQSSEIKALKEKFNQQLKSSYEAMGNHRMPARPFFANIAISATGIGLFLVIGKLLMTGSDFFFETTRQTKINSIREVLQETEAFPKVHR